MFAGTAVGVLALRAVFGDQARAQAALLNAATQDATARDGEERRVAEEQVLVAAQLEPLNAALRAEVNGATLVDLFDNEEWWRPFRAQFPLVQIIIGHHVLASRGPDIGGAADDLIWLARHQEVGSATIRLGDRLFVMTATRLPMTPSGRPELEPVLLFGRPSVPSTAVASFGPVAPRFGDHPFAWLALVVGLGGIALTVTGRQRSSPGAMPQPIFHEPTSKMGGGGMLRPDMPVEGMPPGRRTALLRGRPVKVNGDARAKDAGAKIIGSPGLARATSHATPEGDPAEVMSAQTRPAAGHGFGRYRLVERLGEGGMAELFIAEAAGVEGFTRTFVLKRLRSGLLGDKEAVAQFIDEARMQASLVHSNIVPVFDFGVVRGEYFLTQEYIVGRDLARLVHKHAEQSGEGLSEALAYYVAHETLQALSYAHQRHDQVGSPMGIVHRDISAANVMVSLEGEVKLSDFGIVKWNRRISQTRVGVVKGNAYFMSPEQARGQAVDHRSDLFSLAHVLHYCLTGRLLYFGANDSAVLYRAAKGVTPEDLVEIRKLPHPAGQVLEKALALEPDERFQSATEFADALPNHLGAGKRDTARLMQQLFGDELRREATSAVAVV
jgi:hypothetical protein